MRKFYVKDGAIVGVDLGVEIAGYESVSGDTSTALVDNLTELHFKDNVVTWKGKPPSNRHYWNPQSAQYEEISVEPPVLSNTQNWDGLKSDLRNGPLFALGYEIASQTGHEEVKAAWHWLTDAINGRIDGSSEESLKQALAHPEMGIIGRMFRTGLGLTPAQGAAINEALVPNGFFELDYVVEGGAIAQANVIPKSANPQEE